MLFQPFNKATRRETPDFLNAEISRAKFEDSAQQQENALRSGNAIGGASLYNEALGDRSPIADALFGAEETGTSALANSGLSAAEADLTGATLTDAGITLAPEAVGAGTIGTGVGATAGAETALASGAGGSGALASMGPMGWSALAAMALMNL